MEIKRTQKAVDGLDEALVEVVDVGGGPAAIAREELHAHGAPGTAVAHSLLPRRRRKIPDQNLSQDCGLQLFSVCLGREGQTERSQRRGSRGLTSRKSLAIAWFEGAAAAVGDGGETGAR